MSDAMAESLNYASQKRRAVSSRSYRVKISPVNGQNFIAGQTVNIDMPTVTSTYVNWNQCYLKYKVTPTGGALTVDKAASCFISRVQAMTAGAQLYDCPSWNVLMNVLLDTDSGPSYKAGYGNVLMGTRGSDPAGEVIADGTSRVFCVPFSLSSPFAMSTPHRLMPLSSSAPVQFKITLASINEAGYSTTDAVTKLAFDEVELVCVFTELSSAAEQQVQSMNQGQFNILANSWQAISTNMDAGSTAVTSNIGISVSSLERVIVVHRPTKSSTIAAAYSQSNRISNGLTEWQLLINGEAFPQRAIKNEDSGAEIVAEYLLSDHSLVNFDKQSSFNVAIGLDGTTNYNGLDGASVGLVPPSPFTIDFADADGDVVGSNAAAGNIGSFFAGLELETGLSDGRSQRLYSGISTIGSSVVFRGLYAGGAATGACEITFFLGYTVMLSLNSRGTNVWAISV